MEQPMSYAAAAPMEWITSQQAAKMIGVTTDHVAYLVREGMVSAQRFGRVWMISRASALAYAKTERRPGPKPRSLLEPETRS